MSTVHNVISEQLKAVYAVARTEPDLRLLVLFGSRARGARGIDRGVVTWTLRRSLNAYQPSNDISTESSRDSRPLPTD